MCVCVFSAKASRPTASASAGSVAKSTPWPEPQRKVLLHLIFHIRGFDVTPTHAHSWPLSTQLKTEDIAKLEEQCDMLRLQNQAIVTSNEVLRRVLEHRQQFATLVRDPPPHPANAAITQPTPCPVLQFSGACMAAVEQQNAKMREVQPLISQVPFPIPPMDPF